MMRITKIEEDRSSVTLRVEGRIVSEWADVLEQECLKWLDRSGKVQLECTAVSYIDDRGVEVLKGLAQQHIRIIRCPVFIEEMLHWEGHP